MLIRTRPATAARSSGWCCTSATSTPWRAGTRGPPALGAHRPHQRRGAAPTTTGSGARTCRRTGPRSRAEADPGATVDDELTALDELRAAAPGTVRAPTSSVTNLDKVLFPGRDGEPPVTKRELLRYTAPIAPTAAALPRRPGAEPHRLPERRRHEGLLAQAAARPRAGLDGAVGQPGGRRGRDHDLPRSSTSRPPWCGLAQPRRPRVAPVDVARSDQPQRPDVRPDRPRPRGPGPAGRTSSSWPGCTAPRFDHLGVAAYPKVTGQRGIQIWVPIARGSDVRRHPRLGRAAVAHRRARWCRSW